MRKFLTGITFTLLIFASGWLFGFGANSSREFTKEAVRVAYQYGKQQGAEEIILAAIQE